MSISRIDSRSTHGWFVRITRGSKVNGTKKEMNAFFSDLKCGGRNEARMFAQIYQEKLFASNPRLPFRNHPQSGNKTGVCGVSYTYKRMRKDRDQIYWGYSVSYKNDSGIRTCRFFSLNKWGRNAFDEAVAFRKAWEEKAAEMALNG